MNDSPKRRNVPVGPTVAAVGAVLLIVSLFLEWYDGGINAFRVFEFLDLLLVLLALATIASLAGGLGLVKPAPSPGVSLAVALFTIFVVASQVINDPPVVSGDGGPGKEIGIWLALGGSGLMVVGAVLGYARLSLSVEPRAPEPSSRAPGDGSEDPTVATPADPPDGA